MTQTWLTLNSRAETFQTYIDDEILVRQPMKFFAKPGAKQFAKRRLFWLLLSRTRKANGLNPEIPRILSRGVEALSAITSETASTMLEKCVRAFVEHGETEQIAKYLMTAWTRRTIPQASELDQVDHTLALAIGAETGNAVRVLLGNGHSPWSRSRVYGSPLEIAVAIGPDHANILSMVVHAASRTDNLGGSSVKTRSVSLLAAITKALDSNQQPAVLQLCTLVASCHHLELTSRQLRQLVLHAITSNCESVIAHIAGMQGLSPHIDQIIARAAIESAGHANEDAAMFLVGIYLSTWPRLSRPQLRELLHAACYNNMLSLLDELFKQSRKCESATRDCQRLILSRLRWLRFSRPMLDLALDHGVIEISGRYRLYDPDAAQSMLYHVVSRGHVDLARSILERMGKTRCGYGGDNEHENSVLSTAIVSNDIEAVRLLLEYGFDPEGSRRPTAKSTFELARPKSHVARVIGEAIEAKITEQGDNYTAPIRSVWNEKTQVDEDISYSLLPPQA